MSRYTFCSALHHSWHKHLLSITWTWANVITLESNELADITNFSKQWVKLLVFKDLSCGREGKQMNMIVQTIHKEMIEFELQKSHEL